MTDLDPLSTDFASRFPDAFARTLARMAAADVHRILSELPPSIKAAVAARLPGSHIDEILSSGQHDPAAWLVDASFEDAVTLLSRIPREERLTLINSLPDRDRRHQLLRKQQYPLHSVGALVGDIPLRFDAATPTVEVMAEIRELGDEDPGALVVVDHQGRYLGALDLWKLLLRQRPSGTVGEFTLPVPALFPETSILTAADSQDWDQHAWLAVTDRQRRVLGSVSRAAIFKAARGLGSDLRSAPRRTPDPFDELVLAMVDVLDGLLARKPSV